jgi:hypothetical protein
MRTLILLTVFSLSTIAMQEGSKAPKAPKESSAKADLDKLQEQLNELPDRQSPQVALLQGQLEELKVINKDLEQMLVQGEREPSAVEPMTRQRKSCPTELEVSKMQSMVANEPVEIEPGVILFVDTLKDLHALQSVTPYQDWSRIANFVTISKGWKAQRVSSMEHTCAYQFNTQGRMIKSLLLSDQTPGQFTVRVFENMEDARAHAHSLNPIKAGAGMAAHHEESPQEKREILPGKEHGTQPAQQTRQGLAHRGENVDALAERTGRLEQGAQSLRENARKLQEQRLK